MGFIERVIILYTVQEIIEFLEEELDKATLMWRYCEEKGYDDGYVYCVEANTYAHILEVIDPQV